MASWIDFLALALTICVVGGVIYGILYISRQISESVESTKEKLKNKGLHVTDKGVSIKTSKRFDREDYVDATQRGFVKAMGAASFRKADDPIPSPPVPERRDSSSSMTGHEEKKKKSLFKRNNNGSKDKI